MGAGRHQGGQAAQAAKVGVFTLLVLAVLLVSLLVIGGFRWQRRVETYYVVTERGVDGIDRHSQVTMHGVAIGQVAAIELDRELAGVQVTLAIDPGVPIPAGTRAYFERVGLTGERVVDLRGGSLGAGRLPPGTAIPRSPTGLERLADDAVALGGRLDELAGDLDSALADLDATVLAVRRRVEAVDPEQVSAILDAVEPAQIAAILGHGERASASLARAGASLDTAVGGVRADVAVAREALIDTLADADRALDRLDAATRSATRLLDSADQVVRDNRADLRQSVRQLRRATHDAEALLEAVREQPSLLLRRPRRPRRTR